MTHPRMSCPRGRINNDNGEPNDETEFKSGGSIEFAATTRIMLAVCSVRLALAI